MSDQSASKNKLRVVDLCAGLGGFHQGIHEFFENKAWEETKFGAEWSGYECVLASELNEGLREKYVENHKPSLNYEYYDFPDDTRPDSIDKSMIDLDDPKKIHGDMSLLIDEEAENDSKDAVTARLHEIEEKLNLKQNKQAYLERFQKGTVRKYTWPHTGKEDYVIPEFDMLCAGFPCQPFSQSGKQQGFDDDRGNVWNMIRIILQSHRPKYVFLENVPHFKSHDNGNTWKRVHDELLILGYKVHSRVLSPQDVGELQTRKRFFIVGQRTDKKFSPFARTLPPMKAEGTALDVIKQNRDDDSQSRSTIPANALEAIEHWQILLNMVHAYNEWCLDDKSNGKPDNIITLPGFPIWGYELDPDHFYPPSDLVSTARFKQKWTSEEKQLYVEKLNEGRRDQLTRYLRSMNGESIQQLTKPNRPSEPELNSSDDAIYLQQMDNYVKALQEHIDLYDNYAKSYTKQSRQLEKFYGTSVGKWSSDTWKDWLEDEGDERPTYTKNDKGWNPQSKSQYDKKQFIERVRKWAVENLFGKIATKDFDDFIRGRKGEKDQKYNFLFRSEIRSEKHSEWFRFSFDDIDEYYKEKYPQPEKHHRWLRWWLDKLKDFPHSYQKLELTIGEKEREKHVRLHGEYLLQTRPSGIRVKDPCAIPTLVAQGDSQVPIYSEYNSEDPKQKLSDIFKKISVSAQLAFQGFPKDFTKGLSSSAASKALGNAVNVKLITAILELWLLPENSAEDVDSEEQP